MTAGWFLLSLLVPPAAAVAAGVIFRGRLDRPIAAIVLNALAPGAGLAAMGRPTLEVVLGVLFAQASLLVAGGVSSAAMLIPIAIIAGVWASFYTPLNPIVLASSGPLAEMVRDDTVPKSSTQPSVGSIPDLGLARSDSNGSESEAGYSIAVPCTECGAAVDVPVLSHMARCTFCDSKHLVVGHDDTLYVTLPEKVSDETGLLEVVLDHYRYLHYLELYRRVVAPLEAGATEAASNGSLVSRPEGEAAVAAAEALASRKADAYRNKLARSLQIRARQRFLAPYRHGVGTLFQVAFGRDKRTQDKDLRFAIRTIEAATQATTGIDLPKMGKLSYLRALEPAAHCPESVKTLPLDLGEDDLLRAFGNLDRKQLVRDLDVIRLGGSFTREISAVIWRPWWIVDTTGPDIHESLLIDCAAASVAGRSPSLDETALEDLPTEARSPGSGLRFVPMECPTCGYEYPFDPDAVLHFCTNCHRVCRVDGHKKQHIDYFHLAPPSDDRHDLVPFWCFPLRLRSADGRLATDLMHFKDGIDGTLDQIGEDAPKHKHLILTPAFRCINSRLMATAFERIFHHAINNPPQLKEGRFSLTDAPRPWSVALDEDEARMLLPLYLVHALGPRDIARVRVNQVANWVFDATQEAPGRLVYMPVPRVVTEPFRNYVGRYRSQAVRRARAARAG